MVSLNTLECDGVLDISFNIMSLAAKFSVRASRGEEERSGVKSHENFCFVASVGKASTFIWDSFPMAND